MNNPPGFAFFSKKVPFAPQVAIQLPRGPGCSGCPPARPAK
jgi:hypothetical protein